ncbi:MAG: hypothetical protein AAF989_15390, partial [Planctomycetota bacterium]
MSSSKTLNQILALMTLPALAAIVGCAGDRVCMQSNLDACPSDCQQACATDCIPVTVGQSPPSVALAEWKRCVEPIDCEAVPAPAGTYVTGWREAQWAGAQQRHWVITRNQWFSGGDQLSPEGLKHLESIATTMQQTPNWVVIETQPLQLESEESYEEALQRNEQLQ